jgi:DNA-binding MarR family transcriptional regulator
MSNQNSAVQTLLQTVRALYEAIERFDAAAAQNLDVDRSGLRAINAMEHGAISPSELAVRLGLTSGAVTALLDRLEKVGQVTRHASSDDRRRKDAALTADARAKAGAQFRKLAKQIGKEFASCSVATLQESVDSLCKLHTAFDAAASATAFETKKNLTKAARPRLLNRE